MNEFLRD